ncbi:MAG TPA: hypothetical protein VEH04_14920 [Verrucomicrobiae bacterium]|nr:hypothetical protein [Verrucomicrobiae bacterium]
MRVRNEGGNSCWYSGSEIYRHAWLTVNAELVRQYPDHVCRVTSDEGDVGHGHRGRFQDVETRSHVILTGAR